MASLIATTPQQQKLEFYERLSRVQRGGRNTSQQVHVGPVEEVMEMQAGGRKAAKRAARAAAMAVAPSYGLRQVLGSLIAAPLAIVIGAVAVVGGRILRVSFLGGGLTGTDAVRLMAWDLGLAVLIALALRMVLRYRGAWQAPTVLGMAVALLVMHNLVHADPELWTALFTPAWVQDVLATTKPGTLLFAGNSYTF